MIVVTVVSLRVGHVTFCASARTSCMNLNGLTFAITLFQRLPRPILRTRPAAGSFWGLGSSRKSVTGPLTMSVTYCRSAGSSSETGLFTANQGFAGGHSALISASLMIRPYLSCCWRTMNRMVFGVCATALKAPERNGAAQRSSTETVMQQISARNIQSRLQHALEPDTWLSPTPRCRIALAPNIKDETD